MIKSFYGVLMFDFKDVIMHKLFAFLISIMLASAANADGLIYFGSGPAATGTYENKNAPYTIGYITTDLGETNWGIDISGEGTVIDSTYGQNGALNQALSFNIIAGQTAALGDNSKVTFGLLIGFREGVKACADSYLGFQCYANTSPEVDYDFNYGGVVMLSFGRFGIGARHTQESTQALLGFSF